MASKIDYIPEDVAETDFYICGKCASARLENYDQEEKEHWESLTDFSFHGLVLSSATENHNEKQ